jgi:hypothetical protein
MKEITNSRLFTKADLETAKIENAIYDEHSERWDITVRHNDIAYTVLTYELGHPEDVNEGEIAFIVETIMLTMENKSLPKVEIKRKFEVNLSSIANVNLVDLNKSEPKPLNRNRYLVHDKIGDESFFSESEVLEKGHVHIILDKQKMKWDFGRYNQDRGWFKGDQVVRVGGKRIRLSEFGDWEYMEELPQSNNLEFNGRITRDMLINQAGAVSKFNVHLLLNADKMTWNYGPDNQDYGWLGEGRQIYIQGIGVSLGNKETTEGGYSWEYL